MTLPPVILDTVILVPRCGEEANPVKLSITELAGSLFSSDWVDLGPVRDLMFVCRLDSQVNQENERKTRGNQLEVNVISPPPGEWVR